MKKRNKRIFRKKRFNRFNLNPLKFTVFFVSFLVIVMSSIYFYKTIANSGCFIVDRIDSAVDINRNIEKLAIGKKLFDVNIASMHRKITKQHPEIKKVLVKRVFPSTIKIDVVKRIPVAQFKKDGFYLLDEEFVVLDRPKKNPYQGFMIVELGDYRKIIYKGRIIDDLRLDLAFRLIKELKRSSLTKEFNIVSINAASSDGVSFFLDKVNVIVGRDKFRDKLFLLKELMLNRFNNNLSDLRSIDLRFASSIENIYCIPR